MCGSPVDPLRAREVLLLEDGFRYLCDARCRDRFRAGERVQSGPARRTPRANPRATPSKGAPASEPTAAPRRPRASTPPARAHAPVAEPQPPGLEIWQWLGMLTTGSALVLGLIPTAFPVALTSVALTCATAAITLHASAPLRREVGFLPYVIGPLGVVLAALAALWARANDPQAWGPLVGAAVAAGAVFARIWTDREALRPVSEKLAYLRATIPDTVRIPIEDADNPFEMGLEPVSTDAIRTGEQVLGLEGEVIAVDGVVQAGDARVLLHPGAVTPVRRRPGDPLLAGARVVEGAVRLLVTRVGEDRGLVRPARFGRGAGPHRETASIGRLAQELVRWGGVGVVIGALGGLALVDADGLAGQLSAAAAVLVAAPLLTLRRTAESPWVAAGATAGERGIVYASARAMDAAGRVTVVALCTHGTVTDGTPEVVEVHGVDEDVDTDRVVALIAGAEAASNGHPLAVAIRRYAERRGIAPEAVRRATVLPGRGVTALGPEGEPIVLGNRQLLLDEGVSVAVADAEAGRAEERGDTVLFAAIGGRVRAVVAMQDNVRLGARAAAQRLFDLHVEVVLVSGDHRTTAEALARNLGITHVRADLLPEERGAEVARLREHGGAVAAVGHGDRDGAALAGADVPVVLEGAGAPAGERGIGLVTGDLRDAAAALWIARAARTASWRATLTTVAGGTLLVTGAAIGWLAPGLAGVLAVALDAWALPAGARLLRRISLRIPTRA